MGLGAWECLYHIEDESIGLRCLGGREVRSLS